VISRERKVPGKLIERSEESCPAVTRLGQKENAVAQALHINAVARHAILFRESPVEYAGRAKRGKF